MKTSFVEQGLRPCNIMRICRQFCSAGGGPVPGRKQSRSKASLPAPDCVYDRLLVRRASDRLAYSPVTQLRIFDVEVGIDHNRTLARLHLYVGSLLELMQHVEGEHIAGEIGRALSKLQRARNRIRNHC